MHSECELPPKKAAEYYRLICNNYPLIELTPVDGIDQHRGFFVREHFTSFDYLECEASLVIRS